MLTRLPLPRHLAATTCSRSNIGVRFYSAKGLGKPSDERRNHVADKGGDRVRLDREEREANLYEQLFGPATANSEQEQVREQEVPRIPYEVRGSREQWRPVVEEKTLPKSQYQRAVEESQKDHQGVSVLVLRNASKNLVEDDFRRLVPQGSHLEGWNLEQGDIIRVIPGRDMGSLEQANYYFLLFKSAMSAFAYQGHVSRVHKIVAAHTPSSIFSPMMPPPGSREQNMDANAAIQSFSLVPPNQDLDLRQLKPPLTPVMQAIVRSRGYPLLGRRKIRMPYEARLTLEGPQVGAFTLQQFFRIHGRARGLSWSGSERQYPTIRQWMSPKSNEMMSERASGVAASRYGLRHGDMKSMKNRRRASSQTHSELAETAADTEVESQDLDLGATLGDTKEEQGAKAAHVFIVGFDNERAMQSFVHYWHRRPLQQDEFHLETGSDTAPIANVEVLW